MSVCRPGFWAAKALVRLRVVLAGEGTVRDSRGIFRATLPGSEAIVEIDDRDGTAQLVHPRGETGNVKMELNGEAPFCAFMHAVDVSMTSSGRIPAYLLELADEYARVCAEGDVSLASIVSDGNVDLPHRTGEWSPGLAFRGLVEAASHSPDQHLSDTATRARSYALDEESEIAPFNAVRSQKRWFDQVERWASAGAASYPAGSGTWVEIKTRSGLHSASREVETTMSAVLAANGKRAAFEDVTAYALYDEAGDIAALGIVHEGDLSVHPAPDAEPIDDAVEALRDEVCQGPTGLRHG